MSSSTGGTRMELVQIALSGVIDLEVPENLASDENAIKEYLWQHHKETVLRQVSTSIKNNNDKNDHDNHNNTIRPQLVDASLQKRLNLLDKIAQVQRQFLQSEGPKVVFGCLLEGLLQLMDSEYGFIGEVKYEPPNESNKAYHHPDTEDAPVMYLQTHAITNIAWDAATRAFYKDNVDSGLRFYNTKSLFGTVMVTKEAVISNAPQQDKRACGIPKGHPPLNHFLGIPFFKKGGEMNGMVGVANKPGGYSVKDIEFLEPFTVTCSNLIQAYWQIQQNRHLIETLEEKVRERTQELELANRHLEDANHKVLRASAKQLEHFACMSHEIRTPLNCIIGLSSLLQETDLQPQQEESLKMIVSSGDLLLTVVNDVLDYSKLESGNVEIEVRKSNLQETLDSIVHSIDMKSRDKSLIVRTFYDTSLPEFVHTDSRRLQQILYNLLGNAIKFSKEGGVVELGVCICEASVTGTDPGKEHASIENGCRGRGSDHGVDGASCTTITNSHGGLLLTEEGNGSDSRCPFRRTFKTSFLSETDIRKTETMIQAPSIHHGKACPFACPTNDSPAVEAHEGKCDKVLRFVVKDAGKGIKKEDFEKIFRPFDQASLDTERLYGGTGLGLAITAKLVNGLGGRILVDSTENAWSRFTVELPFRDTPANIEGLSKRMKDTTIILVHTDMGKIARFTAICAAYSVRMINFHNMEEMTGWMQSSGSVQADRSYICLVNEDHYRPEPYKKLASMARSCLLTCGPKYSVKETDGHYRSLLRVVPFVLMQSMSAFLAPSAPVSKTTARLASSEALESPVPYGDLRVLVAEDNLINQKVLARMLKRLGLTNFDVVDNGRKAVHEAKSKEYDVVLMDMQMPVMDGVDACREIVRRRGTRALPKVVFVTAHVENSFEVEGANAGGSGFLPKPFNIKEIEKCFQKLHLSGEAYDN